MKEGGTKQGDPPVGPPNMDPDMDPNMDPQMDPQMDPPKNGGKRILGNFPNALWLTMT